MVKPGGESDLDPKTVFVKGIPYSCDQQAVLAHFSEIGPVKKCFLLEGKEHHKGCGFVSFALPEHATQAIARLAGQPLGGRPLQCLPASKRGPLEERRDKKRKRVEEAGDAAPAADSAPPAAAAESAGAATPAKAAAKPGPQQQVMFSGGPPKGAAAKKKQAATPAAAAAGPGAAGAAGGGVQQQKQRKGSKPQVQPGGERQPGGGGKGLTEAQLRQRAAKQQLVRTVALGNLSPALLKAAHAYPPALKQAETIEYPVGETQRAAFHLERDGCRGEVAFLVYKTVKEAMAAVEQLHGHLLVPSPAPAEDLENTEGEPAPARPSKRSKKAKKQQPQGQPQGEPQVEEEGGSAARTPKGDPNEEALGTTLWARQVSGEGAHLKKWRLIIRNLAFSVTEEQLRSAFQPAGFAWEISVPRKPDGKCKGFAFVGFMTRANAEKGIKTVNGQKLGGRTLAVDWAVSKEDFKAAKQSQPAAAADKGPPDDVTFGRDRDSSDAESDEEEGEGEEGEEGPGSGEPPGGDGEASAQPRKKKKKAQKKGEVQGAERQLLSSVVEALTGEAAGPEGDLGPQGGAGPERQVGRRETGKEAAGAGLRGKRQWDSSKDAPSKPSTEEPQEGGKQRRGAAAAGAMAAKEPQGDSARPSGSTPRQQDPSSTSGRLVFVRGLPLDASRFEVEERLARFGRLTACRLVKDKLTQKGKGTAFAEFASPEAAQKAIRAAQTAREGLGPRVVVGGCAVEVDAALSGEAARNLAADHALGSGKPAAGKDSRNLYLAKEGTIPEGTPAWQALSPGDRAKRQRAAAELRTKLRSPDFAVSRTRLCLRNLPFAVDEPRLKALLLAAVKERAARAQPVLRQVKVLRERDGERRGAAPQGAAAGPAAAAAASSGSSKGLAFAEFTEHEHALCALRQLNNSPVPFGEARRPIVEFAVDNAQVLHKRALRQAAVQAARQQPRSPQAASSRASPEQPGGPEEGHGGTAAAEEAGRAAARAPGEPGTGKKRKRGGQHPAGGTPSSGVGAGPGSSRAEGTKEAGPAGAGTGEEELGLGKQSSRQRRQRRKVGGGGEGDRDPPGEPPAQEDGEPVQAAGGHGKRRERELRARQRRAGRGGGGAAGGAAAKQGAASGPSDGPGPTPAPATAARRGTGRAQQKAVERGSAGPQGPKTKAPPGREMRPGRADAAALGVKQGGVRKGAAAKGERAGKLKQRPGKTGQRPDEKQQRPGGKAEGGGRKRKGGGGGEEATDRLDALAERYRAKLFGGQAGSGPGLRAAMQRWAS